MTTNRANVDRENDSLAELFQVQFEKRLKLLHTAMPGLIVSYNASEHRATVQPSFPLVLNGEIELRRPPIVNVPVVHFVGHGMIGHTPLRAGDPVWIMFSERGIGTWKNNVTREVMPDKGHFFRHSRRRRFPRIH